MRPLPGLLADGRGRGVAAVAVLALAQAGAAGAAAFATRDVFAALSRGDAVVPYAPLALVLLAGLAIAALRIAERTVAERLGQDYAAALRETLFTHVGRMPASAVSARRAGALSLRFVGDLAAVRAWVSVGLARGVSAGIVLPGALVALALVAPALAAAAAAPLAIALLLMCVLAPRLGPLHRRLRSRRSNLAADVSERLPVAPELRLLGRERRELEHLARRTGRLRTAAVARVAMSATLRALPEAGLAGAGACVLLASAHLAMAPAEAAAVLATLAIAAMPLRDLAGIWDRHRAWDAARRKLEGLLASPATERTEWSGCAAPWPVAFLGARAGPVRGARVEASPGDTVAILGANGSGKSTLLALAVGLEPAAPGAVRVAGQDPGRVSLPAGDDGVVYVGARAPILSGSLRRAMTLGLHPRPDDARVLEVARAIGLGSVIERLGGLDGRIAEGGRNLSLGESRRVLLARAGLSRPALLLLDEPEKGLDADGREWVRALLARTPATVLVATHDAAIAQAASVRWEVRGGAVRAVHGPRGETPPGLPSAA